MPYKTPKMTPKAASRARATGKAKAQTRRQILTPGRINEAGTAAYTVARVLGAVVKNVAKGSAKAKTPAKQAPAKPKTLYHGTSTKVPLKKGDRLTRGSGATTNYKFAESYAKGRAATIPSLAGVPRVLQVKPSKTTHVARGHDGRAKVQGAGKNEYNDARGFKVVGKAKPPKPAKSKMKPNPKPRKGNQR